jgi:hypothetical protein
MGQTRRLTPRQRDVLRLLAARTCYVADELLGRAVLPDDHPVPIKCIGEHVDLGQGSTEVGAQTFQDQPHPGESFTPRR